MTKKRDVHRKLQTEAAADLQPVVRPEVIQDLDVPSDDADDIRGGPCSGSRVIR